MFFPPIALFAVVLLVGYIKTRRTIRAVRWVMDTPDRLLRRLLGVSLLPAIAVALGLILRGVAPPASLAVGALLMFGVLVASAGVLGIEGALVEPGSEAILRVARGAPPKSSAAGRAIAVAIGFALALGSSALVWWASHL
jgi:hypothetical protein